MFGDDGKMKVSALKTEESEFNSEIGLFTSQEPNKHDFTLEVEAQSSVNLSPEESAKLKRDNGNNEILHNSKFIYSGSSIELRELAKRKYYDGLEERSSPEFKFSTSDHEKLNPHNEVQSDSEFWKIQEVEEELEKENRNTFKNSTLTPEKLHQERSPIKEHPTFQFSSIIDKADKEVNSSQKYFGNAHGCQFGNDCLKFDVKFEQDLNQQMNSILKFGIN